MLKRYTYGNFVRLLLSYFYTFLFCRKARLIRIPFDIRNSSNIDLGVNLTTGVNCRLEAYSKDSRKKVLHFGNNVQINDYVHIAAMDEVRIGDNVLIASRVFISDISHGQYSGSFHHSPDSRPVSRELYAKSVHIESNVWIGESVCILPGVRIGSGSIIGAGSVVTKSIPKDSIAVGNPARVIKVYDRKIGLWLKL